MMIRQAEQILDVATTGYGPSQDLLIVIDRMGGMRMLVPAGWSQAGLEAEYGPAAIYKVEQRGHAVRVEGRSGTDRCLVQRNVAPRALRDLPGVSLICHPMTLQTELPAA